MQRQIKRVLIPRSPCHLHLQTLTQISDARCAAAFSPELELATRSEKLPRSPPFFFFFHLTREERERPALIEGDRGVR